MLSLRDTEQEVLHLDEGNIFLLFEIGVQLLGFLNILVLCKVIRKVTCIRSKLQLRFLHILIEFVTLNLSLILRGFNELIELFLLFFLLFLCCTPHLLLNELLDGHARSRTNIFPFFLFKLLLFFCFFTFLFVFNVLLNSGLRFTLT